MSPCPYPAEELQQQQRALTQMRSCSSTTLPLRQARCRAVRLSPSPQVSLTSSRVPWASSRITVRKSSSAVALRRCWPRDSSRHCSGARKSFCSYLARIQSSFSSLGKPEGTGHSHLVSQPTKGGYFPFQIYVKKALTGTVHPNLRNSSPKHCIFSSNCVVHLAAPEPVLLDGCRAHGVVGSQQPGGLKKPWASTRSGQEPWLSRRPKTRQAARFHFKAGTYTEKKCTQILYPRPGVTKWGLRPPPSRVMFPKA